MTIATHSPTISNELEVLAPGSADGCPVCDTGVDRQTEVRRVRDGALLRLDRECQVCGTEHPIWFDRPAG